MRPRSFHAGFTLIELLVVVVVIAVIVSIGVLSLGTLGDDRMLRREVYRIGSLLEVAQDEAVMQGREFGLEIMRNSYRFVEFDPFQRIWTEIGTDDQFRFRDCLRNSNSNYFSKTTVSCWSSMQRICPSMKMSKMPKGLKISRHIY